ncbi:MAG TPA: hypothetical protein VF306_20035 [Pirellulales bacterium]
MFRELGWLPPNRAAPHYEAILVGYELTVLRALADELRRAGGRPSDDDGAAQIAEPIDLGSVPVRLAKFRRYRHFWMTISIIGVVLYLILIIALLPIWILAWIMAMLHDASLTKRRLFLYRFRFRGRLLAERQFDRNQRFARCLLDRIGFSSPIILRNCFPTGSIARCAGRTRSGDTRRQGDFVARARRGMIEKAVGEASSSCPSRNP